MARRRPGTHNVRRRFVESQVVRVLAEDYRARLDPGGTDSPRTGDSAEEQSRPGPAAAPRPRGGRGARPHVAAPVAPRIPARPLGRPAAAGGGGQGHLEADADAQRLYRPRSASLDEVPWTVADAALIDEARTLLGPRRAARPAPGPGQAGRGGEAHGSGLLAPGPGGLAGAGDGPVSGATTRSAPSATSWSTRSRTSRPMQLRMLARRSLSGSMTVVGDIAQATGPWAPAGWEDVAAT